jgi:hypothetical protein
MQKIKNISIKVTVKKSRQQSSLIPIKEKQVD